MTRHRADTPTRVATVLTPRIRRWLYGIAAGAAPLAVIYGYVTDQQAALWLNLAGSALFVVAVGNTPNRADDPPRGTSAE